MFAITRFHYIEVLFHIILILLGLTISFIIPRALLYRGSLNQGFTVFLIKNKNYPYKSVYS